MVKTEVMKKYYQFSLILVLGINCISCGKHSIQPKKTGQDGEVVYNKIEYTGTTNLSAPREYMAAAGAGDKIIIAGGETAVGVASNVIDMYDVKTGTWTVSHFSKLSGGFLFAASWGNKIIFSNYSNIEIYDVTTNAWSVADVQLSVTRGNIAMAVGGGKIFFAGGYLGKYPSGIYNFTDVVDIYDIATGTWMVGPPLSLPRICSVAGAAGNKVIFGGLDPSWIQGHGGNINPGDDLYSVSGSIVSSRVDTLGLNSQYTITASNGNYILFDRNLYNTTTDAYENVTYSGGLSGGGFYKTAIGAGTKIIMGYHPGKADIFDIKNKTWETISIGAARTDMVSATAGNKVLIAGGINEAESNSVDILTLSKSK